MLDYAVHIRQLRQRHIDEKPPGLAEALEDVPLEECIGIWGEDLGDCLAAVIHAKSSAQKPLLWHDEQLTTIANDFQFADAVMTVALAMATPDKQNV